MVYGMLDRKEANIWRNCSSSPLFRATTAVAIQLSTLSFAFR